MTQPPTHPSMTEAALIDGPRRLHVVFVSWEYPPAFGGGIGTYVASITRILARRGHRVTVITVTDRPTPWRERLHVEPSGAIDIIRLPIPFAHGADPSLSLSVWHQRADQVYECLQGLVRAGPIDLIEFPDYRGEGLTFLTSTKQGERPPSIVRLHTPVIVLNRYNQGRQSAAVLGAFENEAIIAADQIVSPSQVLAREMQELVPQLARREIHIHPYPLDQSFMQAASEHAAESDEILYVGRLEERKGVQSLIAAAPEVLRRCPNATLRLVGGDTALSQAEPSMLALLERSIPEQFRSRIRFDKAMPREQLVGLYQRAKVCVFPSLFENFPNVCLEAMTLGRCVAAASNSGMAEMIEHNISGLIFPSGESGKLADAVSDLYNRTPEQRRAMGNAARERATSLYDPPRIAQSFETMIREWNSNPGVGPASRRAAIAMEPSARPDAGPTDSIQGDAIALAQSSQPTVGIVIPCYNHGEFLRDAINSALAQTHPPRDIIIVDDGSTDAATVATLETIKNEFAHALCGKGIRVIKQANAGLAAARNTGVRALSTKYYVALDSDDSLEPTFVEKLLVPLEANPSLGYAYSWVQYFGSHSGLWHCPQYDAAKLLVENLSVATALVRREAFDAANGYNPDMVHGFEDWDFWLCILKHGWHGTLVSEPLFRYRKHATGSMLTRTQQRRAGMIQKMVEHHRSLYQRSMPYAITEKDRLFFKDHTDLWKLRESLAKASHAPTPPPADEPVDGAEPPRVDAELAFIEQSRAWKTINLLKRNPIYGAIAKARWGDNWQLIEVKESSEQRLHRIKNSRSYRLIQTIKGTAVYRAYAKMRYGE